MTEIIIKVSGEFLELAKAKGMEDRYELIRCRNCRHRLKNKTCLRTMKRKPDDGYCDEGEKDEGSVLGKYMAV